MNLIGRAHQIVAWLFVAGVIVQVFLAGLGVFDDPATFQIHATWGFTLEILPLALLVLAIGGRLGRRPVIYAVGLFGMFMLQSVFIGLRADLPAVAALHPVNGFAILLVGVAMAREAATSAERRDAPGGAITQAASSTGTR